MRGAAAARTLGGVATASRVPAYLRFTLQRADLLSADARHSCMAPACGGAPRRALYSPTYRWQVTSDQLRGIRSDWGWPGATDRCTANQAACAFAGAAGQVCANTLGCAKLSWRRVDRDHQRQREFNTQTALRSGPLKAVKCDLRSAPVRTCHSAVLPVQAVSMLPTAQQEQLLSGFAAKAGPPDAGAGVSDGVLKSGNIGGNNNPLAAAIVRNSKDAPLQASAGGAEGGRAGGTRTFDPTHEPSGFRARLARVLTSGDDVSCSSLEHVPLLLDLTTEARKPKQQDSITIVLSSTLAKGHQAVRCFETLPQDSVCCLPP